MSETTETQSKRLSIPVTPSLYSEIETIANQQERSAAQQARLFIKKGMEADAQKEQEAA